MSHTSRMKWHESLIMEEAARTYSYMRPVSGQVLLVL